MSDSSDTHTTPTASLDPQTPERGRKRTKSEEQWKRNVAKRKRNRGEEYMSATTNRLVAARHIGNPCTCKAKCFTVVTQQGVQSIFSAFWGLGNFDVQNTYLQKQVTHMEVRRKKTKAEQSRRSQTLVYCVTFQNKTHRVCKQAFLSMHGLTEKRVSNAIKHVTDTAIPKPDMRGRHAPSNKVTADTCGRVKEHIRCLPAMSSHYTRAKAPERKYLESSLTIRTLYDAYLEWMTSEYPGEEQVSFHFYNDVFTNQFNILFEPPKTDTCTTCDTLENRINNESDEEKKRKLAKDKESHLDEAEKAQEFLKAMRNDRDPDTRGICVDLQQILPTPRLSTGVAYYKRKLWTYNFCVHDLKRKVSTMYVWDETQSRRGSIEVASCIKKWVDDEMEKGEFNKLVVVSDNCAGQNKNVNLVLYYLRELHASRLISVDHVYLMPGHSYMDCDRAFGIIEKKIRRTVNVYTPDHYCRIIHTAVANNFPVVRMKQEDFLDFSVMEHYITKRKAPGSTFKDARKIMLRLEFREGYLLKSDYEPAGTNVTEVVLQKGRLTKGERQGSIWSREKFDLSAVPLPPKYTQPLLLRDGKVEDIAFLMKLLPLNEQVFYQKIVDAHRNDQVDWDNNDEDPADPNDHLFEYE